MQHREDNGEGNVYGVSIEELTAAMAEIGNNWERVPLRHAEGREGWEEAMVGCLKDVCVFTVPATTPWNSLQFVDCQYCRVSTIKANTHKASLCTREFRTVISYL
jgi:hypothetical protein